MLARAFDPGSEPLQHPSLAPPKRDAEASVASDANRLQGPMCGLLPEPIKSVPAWGIMIHLSSGGVGMFSRAFDLGRQPLQHSGNALRPPLFDTGSRLGFPHFI